MALTTIDTNPNKKKDIRYLGKDFSEFRENLIDFAKTYYPNTYNDFNESSPGMMFIEMASYIGDVLSYYIDNSLKESLLPYAEERESIINLAQFFGYKIKPIVPSNVRLDVYQLVPSKGSGENVVPDYSYALTVKAGMEVESSTNSSVRFRTDIPVDFSYSSSFDPTEVTVYSRDSSNDPTFYLLKKNVDAIAGTEKTESFAISDATEYRTVVIDNKRIVEITRVSDDDGNVYHEVPFLAQDFVYAEYPNVDRYDEKLSRFKDSVPFLLRLLKTPRRFVTRVRSDKKTELQFGAGISDNDDQILIPTPKNIGLGNNAKSLSDPIDPQNFFQTQTYGKAPSNTTLTVTFIEGGGLSSNVPVGDLTKIRKLEFQDYNRDTTDAERLTLAELQDSITVYNSVPATGGKDEEPIENIRNNALAHFASQNRAVTKRDYEVRALSLPPRFGSIAKVFVVPDGNLDTSNSLVYNGTKEKNNPFAINMYVLGYNKNKQLTSINDALKQNLKTYLQEYRMITDGINILDGFIINIGVDFVITTFSSFNKQVVLTKAIDKVKSFFDVDKWTFNQPLNLSELELEIASVEGVSSVQDITIRNISGGSYSNNLYDIDGARRVLSDNNGKPRLGKIVFPSLDPMCWEVKYPNRDIKGRVL